MLTLVKKHQQSTAIDPNNMFANGIIPAPVPHPDQPKDSAITTNLNPLPKRFCQGKRNLGHANNPRQSNNSSICQPDTALGPTRDRHWIGERVNLVNGFRKARVSEACCDHRLGGQKIDRSKDGNHTGGDTSNN